MKTFNEVKKNFAFGCMRLPMIGEEVDIEQVKQMVDYFIDHGFNYFDTAHGYLNGKSEKALKAALTDRYSRDRYILTDKLTGSYFQKEEDIRPLFQSQLEICGVDYFDFYLMHAQNAAVYEKFKACRAYETAFELKKEGKIRHVGLSFHDTAETLDRILTDYPEIEVVQIQFNYLDYNDSSVNSRGVYEVCEKHNKPVLVMEPVKGGTLVNLPEQAKRILNGLNGGSYASYAIRFAASFKNMEVVLSGMSTLEQMKDNVSFMENFEPLSDEERKAVDQVVEVFRAQNMIPCTGCRYCVDENHCPMKISIPDIFAAYNSKKTQGGGNPNFYYNIVTSHGGKASACVECGMCERVCPQHLTIRQYLKDCAAEFEAN